ncbi:MAG: aldehyde dehydrogenase family protein, partial [Anaerolineae bacterium]|nr:aldehyde dehydrogenase family protein [Anaerolineae bacterium]
MSDVQSFYLAGHWESSDSLLEVRNPFNDEIVGITSFASADQLEQAINAATKVMPALREMATFERAGILANLASRMR